MQQFFYCAPTGMVLVLPELRTACGQTDCVWPEQRHRYVITNCDVWCDRKEIGALKRMGWGQCILNWVAKTGLGRADV